MILNFRTDTLVWASTPRSSLIRVYIVCHFVCIFWMHYSMIELLVQILGWWRPIFRVYNFLRIFTVFLFFSLPALRYMYLTQQYSVFHRSHLMRNPAFRVNQERFKPVCSATGASNSLWISNIATVVKLLLYYMCLGSRQQKSRNMTKPTKWLCAQRRLRSAWASAQSDQSLRCPHEESLGRYLPIQCTAKTLIRLGRCLGWSESSLGAHSFCWFCHVAAQVLIRLHGCASLLFTYDINSFSHDVAHV